MNCAGICTAGVPIGATVTLSAVASDGSRFDGWSSDGCPGRGDCALVANGEIDVTAHFTADVNAVSVRTGGSGLGQVTSAPPGIDCPAHCDTDVDIATVTLTAAPMPDHQFAGWSGPCEGQAAVCTLTFEDLDEPATDIEAHFAPPPDTPWSATLVPDLTSITALEGLPGGDLLVAGRDGRDLPVVARLDAVGRRLWTHTLRREVTVTRLDVAADGSVAAGGWSTAVAPGDNNVESDLIVACLEGQSGQLRWYRTAPWVREQEVVDVAWSGSAVVAVGTTKTGIDLGDGELGSIGRQDLVAWRLDGTDGNNVDSALFGGSFDVQPYAVTALGGDVVLVAAVTDSATIGDVEFVATGQSPDVVIARVRPDNTMVWSRQWNTGNAAPGSCDATTGEGFAVAVACVMAGQRWDVRIVRFDEDGLELTDVVTGDVEAAFPVALASLSGGGLGLSGRYEGRGANFGGTALPAPIGRYDGFAAVYSAQGDHVESFGFADTGNFVGPYAAPLGDGWVVGGAADGVTLLGRQLSPGPFLAHFRP